MGFLVISATRRIRIRVERVARLEAAFLDELLAFDAIVSDVFYVLEHRPLDHAKHDDVYLKILGTMRKIRKGRKEPYLRFTGCPVSVAEQVLFLSELGGVKNPFLTAETATPTTKNYIKWRSANALKRLKGQPYQRAGDTCRGEAKPDTDGLTDNATAKR